MVAPIPAVKIADHADALCVGSPDGETGSCHAVNNAKLGAKLIVNAPLVALPEKVEVCFAERGKKGVWVASAADIALVIGNRQVIGIHPVRFLSYALKQPALVHAFHFDIRLIQFASWPDF